jgi:uncharacterized protein YcfJ
MKSLILTGAALAILSTGACTSTGNTERGAVGGAALGALGGAIIGNNVGKGDAATGAAIGALAGGVGGAAIGASKDHQQQAQAPQRGPNGEEMLYDRDSNRYYYVDRRSGRTYWANGEYRG